MIGQLPLECLLCQQILNGVFSFSSTGGGRTLLMRKMTGENDVVYLYFFLYLQMGLLKSVWYLKNFQRNFPFQASSTMTLFFFFFSGSNVREGYFERKFCCCDSKKHLQCIKAVLCGRSLVLKVRLNKCWEIDFPKPM